MGGAAASSTQTTTTSTQTTSDSFNKTINRVANLSDVGNVAVNIGSGGTDAMDINKLLPFAVVGVVGILAIAIFAKR